MFKRNSENESYNPAKRNNPAYPNGRSKTLPLKRSRCSPSGMPFLLNYMDNNTYVYLWRKTMDTSFYKDSYAFHLAIHILLKANFSLQKKTFKDREMIIPRGSLITGRHRLANETGIPQGTIRRKLKLLEKIGFLTIKRTNKFSIITIEKYEFYQTELVQKVRKRPTSEPTSEPTSGQQVSHKISNTIKGSNGREIPPSPDLVLKYFGELGDKSQAAAFCDYYQSNGWKVGGRAPMKDWRAAARRWIKNTYNAKPDKVTYPKLDTKIPKREPINPEGAKKIKELTKGVITKIEGTT